MRPMRAEPLPVTWALAWGAFAAAVVVLVGALHHHAAALGWPYPYSDEAAHVLKTAELREALAAATTPWRRLGLLVFSGDAYPNAVYASAIGQGASTLVALRASTIAFLLAHVAVALAFGRRLWGAPGALAYVVLVALTAYPLAFSQGYYLDVPLVATVGAAVLLLEASDGFRRPIPAILFVVAATAGLYTKWMWAVFCAVPCVLAALRALGPLPGRRARVAGAAALLALVVGGAWEVRRFGMAVPTTGHFDTGPELALVVGAARVLAGWAVLAVLTTVWVGGRGRVPLRWWGRMPAAAERWIERVRPWMPLANALTAFALVGALAGPWYATVWPRLWERYQHEQGAFEGRSAPVLVDATRILADLVPAGGVLVGVGLLVALVTREGRLAWAARVLGAALGATLAVVWLPSDTRYLVPVLPLLAGAIVAGWRPAARWTSVPLALACAALAGITAVAPLLGHGPLDGNRVVAPAIHGVNVARREGRGFAVPVLVSQPPSVDAATMAGLVDAIDTACADAAPCLVRWSPVPGSPIVPRGVVALARLRGVPAREATGPSARVSGGTRCGTAAPAVGWVGDTWTSAATNGCHLWVRR